MTPDLRDILHTPYELGGRTVGVGIDCLGVVGAIAHRRGMAPPDGWPSIRAAWERGEIDSASGFPPGWTAVLEVPAPTQWCDGDVLLFQEPYPWCSIVDGGHVWSASHLQGSAYCVPLYRWRTMPTELWRWMP